VDPTCCHNDIWKLGWIQNCDALNPSFVDLISLKCMGTSAGSLGYVNEVCVMSMIVFWFNMMAFALNKTLGIQKGIYF